MKILWLLGLCAVLGACAASSPCRSRGESINTPARALSAVSQESSR